MYLGWGYWEGKDRVSATPPASALHKADRSHCVARCGCKHSSSEVSDFPSRAPSPACLLQFPKISHPPGAASLCPSLRGVFTQTGALGFLAVDKATQPSRGWQSVPAIIVGTLDSATEIPRWLGLHSHPGSAPRALPAGSGAGSSSSFLRRAVAAVHVFSSAAKTPPCCQALGAQRGTVGFTPPLPCLWPGSAKE